VSEVSKVHPTTDIDDIVATAAPAAHSQIDATALTTFDVAPNGDYARLHVRDHAGQPATLKLPTACLNQLLMTLPSMVQMALRKSHRDESLRLVHSLDHFSLELGQPDDTGRQQFILTLQTGNGFGVSFVVNRDILNMLSDALSADPFESAPRVASPRTLS